MKKYRVTRFKRIYIEITSSCNLTCSFCQETKRDKRFMSIDEFSHVIEQVKPLTEFIYLHVKGEPLLHPQLGDILQICHDEGMRVNITTNGTLLKKQLDTVSIRTNISYPLKSYLNIVQLILDSLGFRHQSFMKDNRRRKTPEFEFSSIFPTSYTRYCFFV